MMSLLLRIVVVVLILAITGCVVPIQQGDATEYRTSDNFHIGMLVIAFVLLAIAAWMFWEGAREGGLMYLSMVWIPLAFMWMTSSDVRIIDSESFTSHDFRKGGEQRVEFDDVGHVTWITTVDDGEAIEFHLIQGGSEQFTLSSPFAEHIYEIVEERGWPENERSEEHDINKYMEFVIPITLGVIAQFGLIFIVAAIWRKISPQGETHLLRD